jgi:hypothetical protein
MRKLNHSFSQDCCLLSAFTRIRWWQAGTVALPAGIPVGLKTDREKKRSLAPFPALHTAGLFRIVGPKLGERSVEPRSKRKQRTLIYKLRCALSAKKALQTPLFIQTDRKRAMLLQVYIASLLCLLKNHSSTLSLRQLPG